MSAAALRAPARWTDAARAHLAASAPAGLVGLAAVAAVTRPGQTARDVPFDEAGALTMLMLFLPLVHWRGRGSSRSLDQGLPMDDARQEWIRTACGALWAVLTVGAALAVHVLMDTRLRSGAVTYAPGLPVSILARALGAYLLGAAVLARTDRPGRTLLVALGLMAVLVAVGELLTRSLMSTHSVTEYLPRSEHVRVPGWTRATLLPLVLGVGAVWVSGLLGRHGGALRSLRARWIPAGSATRPPPRTRPVRLVPGPRRAAGFGAAAVRQFGGLRGRLGWAAAGIVAFYTLSYFRLPMDAASVEIPVMWATVFWPALVWLEERGRGRDWDDSVPVGRVPLRIAHALAGAVWLMAAVVPGALIHPAGIAVPAAALAMYLAVTAGAALLERPVLGCLVAGIGIEIASFTIAPEHPLSLARALAPLGGLNDITWSAAASGVWLPLLAAAAGATLHLQARRDRNGRTLPALRRAPRPA